MKNEDGTYASYTSLNPKGKVPAIRLQGGEILTENQTILQYIALELAPEKQLMPQHGLARWRAQELFNFITTDIHKCYSPLFNPDISPKHRNAIIDDLGIAFSVLQDILGDKPYLLGQDISIMDTYAWTLLTWTRFFSDVDIAAWPRLVDYCRRILQLPSVQRTLKEEGLVFEF